MTSAAIEAAKQEQKFYSAILRVVGERGIGHRPIEEVTTRDVEAMAKACMQELPKRRPPDLGTPGPRPLSPVRVRPSQVRSRSSIPAAPPGPTGGCDCDASDCGMPSIGWRFYLDHGWLPVCSRHMTGAGAAVRRYDDGQRAGFGPDGVTAGPGWPSAGLGAAGGGAGPSGSERAAEAPSGASLAGGA